MRFAMASLADGSFDAWIVSGKTKTIETALAELKAPGFLDGDVIGVVSLVDVKMSADLQKICRALGCFDDLIDDYGSDSKELFRILVGSAFTAGYKFAREAK